MRILLLCALSLLAAAAARAAGPLAPARPSDIVALAASPEPACASAQTGMTLDARMTPDGTYVDLVVPPKRVLVLTEVRWIIQTIADEEVSAVIRIGPQTAGFIGLVLPSARAGANGRATGEAKFAPGLVVRNPAELCVSLFANGSLASPGNLSGAGFFAKDR